IFRPVTPDAPNRSNRNPPTKAPTIPSAMSSQKPWPCLLTILLPMNPAIRPSIIQLMMPMVAPPVKSRSSSKNTHPHNSNRCRPGQSSVLTGSTDERRTRLRRDFSGILRFRRQLKHRCFLAGGQDRQEHYLAVGKLQGVMMSGASPFVDLTKDRRLAMNDLMATSKRS